MSRAAMVSSLLMIKIIIIEHKPILINPNSKGQQLGTGNITLLLTIQY
jgi:hypothetical protein